MDWTFTASTDKKKPRVSGRTPQSGETGVPRSADVRVTFSEAMRGSTLTTTTVSLEDTSNGSIVAAVVTYAGSGHRVTLDPSGRLRAHRTYRVLLSSSIRDKAGNRLSPVTWTFRTSG